MRARRERRPSWDEVSTAVGEWFTIWGEGREIRRRGYDGKGRVKVIVYEYVCIGRECVWSVGENHLLV